MSVTYIIKSKILYQLSLPDGKVSQPPEKCYHCDKASKPGDMCNVENCEVSNA